jgi:hypothetical protein
MSRYNPIMKDAFEAVESGDLQELTFICTNFDFPINSLDPDTHSETLLFGAVKLRNPEIVAYLLSQGADPLSACYKGTRTPLSFAEDITSRPSMLCRLLFIRTLLDSRVDINQNIGMAWGRGEVYETPLIYAVIKGYSHAFKYLLERRNPELHPASLRQALRSCIENDCKQQAYEIMQELFRKDKDILSENDEFFEMVEKLRAKNSKRYWLDYTPGSRPRQRARLSWSFEEEGDAPHSPGPR